MASSRKSSVTIYDVAQHADVSITTVSRVLNAPELVTPATRERVLATIDRLGFVPKTDASARARRNLGQIGVLAPFFTYPSFVQRLHGVSNELAGSPYELVIYNVDSIARRDAYLVKLPSSRHLDALIVMALPLGEPVSNRLLKQPIETVLIESASPSFSSIVIDNERGGRMAAEFLVARGHRRCGFVGDVAVPEYALFNSDTRLRGYRHALRDAGLEPTDKYIALGENGLQPAKALAHRLLDLPEPPTAIFAASDTQAIGVLQAARERQIDVPGHLAVIGFDDVDMAEYIGLTTIRQPLEESGRVAVELLFARLADPERPLRHVTLPLSIVQRQTA